MSWQVARRDDDLEEEDDAPRSTRTRDELYEEAKALNIEGRSQMNKQELEEAVDRRRGRR